MSTAGQLDAFGHKAILSGTSRYLSELIHDKLQCKSRAIEFSTLQRCASHLASRTDVNEAYAVGGAAAAAAFAGESGRMIALKRVSNYPYLWMCSRWQIWKRKSRWNGSLRTGCR